MELYNQELKERFLEQYPETTRLTYRNIFKKTALKEKELRKDLYQFNLEELDDLLYSLGSTSAQYIATALVVIAKYIDFCLQEGYIGNPAGINYARLINPTLENLKKYEHGVDRRYRYIDREELQQIINMCVNDQDAVIFALLFEGVMGENLEELINLKVEDCNFMDNILTLRRNNGTKRRISVQQDTMKLINKAINQVEYYRVSDIANGVFLLQRTPYVLRPIVSEKVPTEQVSHQIIRNRLKKIAEMYGNPYLNPKNIFRSGMIDYIRRYMKKNDIKSFKDLDHDDMANILMRFGIDPTNQNIYLHRIRLREYV
ncbi:hypothetical protein SAMN04244560_01929 [Thermoanaerobacter thermohydrosulfuricus]|uniref:Site-specific recombinase XerD n=1 Tax=Thermoanaerobacter thermohydrosulfuricus TaxID=1516 RepID=A0A1G7S7J6_THETY|nr:site-specific integrase [Thermoanaerobacter thermohydrosulfuricus]SDG18997.1 hypothetical protein SAMN04244560_01929 [Thermoanaerobacter thermohydrosulfuricus]